MIVIKIKNKYYKFITHTIEKSILQEYSLEALTAKLDKFWSRGINNAEDIHNSILKKYYTKIEYEQNGIHTGYHGPGLTHNYKYRNGERKALYEAWLPKYLHDVGFNNKLDALLSTEPQDELKD